MTNPRSILEIYLVDAVVEKNGCKWAELFKLGNKLVNKPQQVKVEDLLKVNQKRQSATKAAQTIKDLIPYIRAVVHSMVPKHPWDYQRMMEMYRSGDLFYEDENFAAPDADIEEDIASEDIETEEDDSDKFLSASENSHDSSSQNSTDDDDDNDDSNRGPNNSFDNPNIQMYPQSSVQNLAEVFDNLYQDPRSSERLAAKPRRNYKGAHERGQY